MNKAIVHLLILVLATLTLATSVCADVLISEMCDPRSNYSDDRFIEIYNAGDSAVSLSGWSLIAVGNSNDIFTWNLSGQIQPGQALVAGDASTDTDFTVDFPAEAWSTNNGTWNGKTGDGAKLRNSSGSIVDNAVVSSTVFENDDLVRNENIHSPSSSYNGAQWTATAVDTPAEASPGVHHAPPPVTGPEITSIVTDPTAPLAGDTVNVNAVVVDGDAAITSVVVNWGLSAAALTHEINLVNSSGNLWTTTTAIPAQTAGTTVHYAVTATNDEPAANTSDIQSYGLPYSLSIADIQGLGSTSTHVGHDVITSGVVTARFGTTCVIQDGTNARDGIWVSGVSAPATGTRITVAGLVQENSSNTTITSAQIIDSVSGTLPAAIELSTTNARSEDWEGLLVRIVDADCTSYDATSDRWYVSTGGSSVLVENLGTTYAPTVGSIYTLTAVMNGTASGCTLVPRTSADIVFVDDPIAPELAACEAQGPTDLLVTFTEDLATASAQNSSNYQVTGSSVTSASLVSGHADQVRLTVSYLSTGTHTLTVNGVTDTFGNAMVNETIGFTFYGGNVPVGYYNGTDGLTGDDLRAELHGIVDNHTSRSYSYLWSAFYTTDVKPNGKLWDMYSDNPDGNPPYEYTLGSDQTGGGATEGTGYNREHSWPKSWYGGEVSPMFTDLFVVYPTDVRVNGMRSNHPFGEVGSPTWTSMNGCKLGSCSYPGYSGTVFEPIDEYKGDFARSYFYMTVRYYNEDGSWPGSGMVDGAQLLPWAENMLLEWHAADPVSQKEIDRNDAVYDIQHNRNPFIDRPDFVLRVFRPEIVAVPDVGVLAAVTLHQNVPNPFNPSTTISYELPESGSVDLQVFDVAGRLVRTLYQGQQTAGEHSVVWAGRNQQGQTVATGLYFYRLQSEQGSETRRMLLVK